MDLDAASKALLKQRYSLTPMPAGEGLRALEAAIGSSHSDVCVLYGCVPRVLEAVTGDIKNLAVAGSVNTSSKLFDKSDFADGNFFVDVTKSVRFGLEYAWFRQHYLDDVKGTNHRVQLSGFYIF